MTLDVVFEEQEKRLPCDFESVHVIADVGVYNDGYADGKKVGYADGFAVGRETGYGEGYDDGRATLDDLLGGTAAAINSNAGRLRNYAFHRYSTITRAVLPMVTSVGDYAFFTCTNLKIVDMASTASIGNYAFNACQNLDILILRGNAVCSLSSTNAFNSTPIASGTGYVYVPRDLVDSYKTATNWVTFADQIRAIEDYPDITGGSS